MLSRARLPAIRSFIFSPASSLHCRAASASTSGAASLQVREARRRLVTTTRPRLATLATSATSSSSSSSRTLGPPPSRTTDLLKAPTQADIDDAELDVEPVPPGEARIRLTDRAAEHLRNISVRDNDPRVALRISVESGGCHGYQYKMDLTSDFQPDDYLFAHPDIRPSNVVIDAVSMPLLKGCTLDFATELIGSSFRIDENPQAKGSGCGCGVSWELKV